MIKDVKMGMEAQDFIRDLGALMISRDKKDLDPRIGYLLQRCQGHFNQSGGNTAPEKKVASMDDRIDFLVAGRL
jgi:hypothetical protein